VGAQEAQASQRGSARELEELRTESAWEPKKSKSVSQQRSERELEELRIQSEDSSERLVETTRSELTTEDRRTWRT
jgi:hypothetical protein